MIRDNHEQTIKNSIYYAQKGNTPEIREQHVQNLRGYLVSPQYCELAESLVNESVQDQELRESILSDMPDSEFNENFLTEVYEQLESEGVLLTESKTEESPDGLLESIQNGDPVTVDQILNESWNVWSREELVEMGYPETLDEDDGGIGNVAGNIGVDVDIEAVTGRSTGYPPADPPGRRKTHKNEHGLEVREGESLEESCDPDGTFAGNPVFKLPPLVFENFMKGKNRYHAWDKYLNEDDDSCKRMKAYKKKNPGKTVIVENRNNGHMYYVYDNSKSE